MYTLDVPTNNGVEVIGATANNATIDSWVWIAVHSMKMDMLSIFMLLLFGTLSLVQVTGLL